MDTEKLSRRNFCLQIFFISDTVSPKINKSAQDKGLTLRFFFSFNDTMDRSASGHRNFEEKEYMYIILGY